MLEELKKDDFYKKKFEKYLKRLRKNLKFDFIPGLS